MRPPPGSALTLADFFISSSWLHNIVQTTTHDDVFPLRRAQSPSLTFNLVGRRLRSAKRVADTLPASGRRFIVACRADHLRTSKPPAIFQRKKYLNAPLPPLPPPLQFHHPPLPAMRLEYIQRVRSRLSEDINRGTGGFTVINIILLFYYFSSVALLTFHWRQHNNQMVHELGKG